MTIKLHRRTLVPEYVALGKVRPVFMMILPLRMHLNDDGTEVDKEPRKRSEKERGEARKEIQKVIVVY